jgi:hypothetical protein
MLVLTPMMALSSSSYRKIYLRVQEMRRPSCPREHAIADDAALDSLVPSKIVVSLASRQ